MGAELIARVAKEKSMRYLALLRGINVGGKNIIKMAQLKACFEGLGFAEVQTYIQSGNVLFTSAAQGKAALTAKVERGLSKAFGYEARVVLRSQAELKATIRSAPAWFGQEPAKHRYNVLFLKEPLNAQGAAKSISLKEGVDRIAAGKGALYFSHLIAKASQSRLSKVIQLPIYQHLTIRNWNTTSKLGALMQTSDKK